MSIHEYYMAVQIKKQDSPFYGIIMAAMLRADTGNLEKLKAAFPEQFIELNARYNSPGGHLEGDI